LACVKKLHNFAEQGWQIIFYKDLLILSDPNSEISFPILFKSTFKEKDKYYSDMKALLLEEREQLEEKCNKFIKDHFVNESKRTSSAIGDDISKLKKFRGLL
jgi:hypothetical protein